MLPLPCLPRTACAARVSAPMLADWRASESRENRPAAFPQHHCFRLSPGSSLTPGIPSIFCFYDQALKECHVSGTLSPVRSLVKGAGPGARFSTCVLDFLRCSQRALRGFRAQLQEHCVRGQLRPASPAPGLPLLLILASWIGHLA